MSLDFEKVFTYVFKDEKWLSKVFIGSIFAIGMYILNFTNSLGRFLNKVIDDSQTTEIAPYLDIIFIGESIAYLIGGILNSFFEGYSLKNTNQRIFKPESGLADWNDFGSIFSKGLCWFIGVLVYVIIWGIGILILFMPSIAFPPLFILLIIWVLAFWFVYPAVKLSYSTDLKFASLFNFKLIGKFMTQNIGSYLLYILLLWVLYIIYTFAYILALITIVGILLFPFITTLCRVMINELSAQYIRKTLALEESEI